KRLTLLFWLSEEFVRCPQIHQDLREPILGTRHVENFFWEVLVHDKVAHLAIIASDLFQGWENTSPVRFQILRRQLAKFGEQMERWRKAEVGEVGNHGSQGFLACRGVCGF